MTKLDKAVRPGGFQGYLDGYIDQRLQGWVRKNGEDDPVRVDILLNGDPVYLDVLSNAARDDLVEGGIGPGTFGFQVPVDTVMYCGDVRVTVRVSGETQTIFERTIHVPSAALEEPPLPSVVTRDETLDSTADLEDDQPVNDNSAAKTDPAPKTSDRAAVAPPPKAEYKVRLEQLTETSLGGWAVDVNNPGAIFSMELFINGAWFCEVRNDATRPDLRRLNLSKGRGGSTMTCRAACWTAARSSWRCACPMAIRSNASSTSPAMPSRCRPWCRIWTRRSASWCRSITPSRTPRSASSACWHTPRRMHA
ncbi:hypothetical protein [Tateyamaria omphalii]|uniref:hypothetical protein n=1 Tax=Tateyamaria omphalii TaxID=299262 RepID=UPI0020C77948|nr:hypothetical protein [Tateyamaria omphalii]